MTLSFPQSAVDIGVIDRANGYETGSIYRANGYELGTPPYYSYCLSVILKDLQMIGGPNPADFPG